MPRGNRRGPNGLGPVTGRGAGFCAGSDEAGFVSAPDMGYRPRHGYRSGPGFGGGQGRRRGPWWPGDEEAKSMMSAEIEAMEHRIASLRREIEALDTTKATEDECE